jgi:hypothetical protein
MTGGHAFPIHNHVLVSRAHAHWNAHTRARTSLPPNTHTHTHTHTHTRAHAESQAQTLQQDGAHQASCHTSMPLALPSSSYLHAQDQTLSGVPLGKDPTRHLVPPCVTCVMDHHTGNHMFQFCARFSCVAGVCCQCVLSMSVYCTSLPQVGNNVPHAPQ